MKDIGRPSHNYLGRWSCALLRRCAKVARSIWDNLSYGHTGPFGHRTMFGWSWIIGGESCVIVRCYTTSQPSRAKHDVLAVFGHVQKPDCDARDRLEYRTIITRRRVTSLDFMRRRGYLYHIFTCSHVHGLLTMLCHGRAKSYGGMYQDPLISASFYLLISTFHYFVCPNFHFPQCLSP